ncbi:ureidoglycolate lyase [Granulosicoccus antarcticus]|uniref:Ureidoglycolate lyase n=1 Tax=Granulosicoccus antarcticus IMCC3135 TaxID=1192854 RepID=A0A2Z2NMX0_9GAMM|nr:ureidoglycolate lyase [Granulosicoccus antarcticus]ASJ72573.1 Ureidoglycolate lyase [Granulosicoccus antarcticus IMCC3135]
MTMLAISPLTAAAFAPFGDVLQVQAAPSVMINRGNCARYSDLAGLDFSDGRAGISVFHAKPYRSPLLLDMMERHPQGSQAFIPMSDDPFLVIVAPDNDGKPGLPQVFETDGLQGVNYHRNVWHGVLTPIRGNGLFTVVDRIGSGSNLEEHWLDSAYQILF